METKTIRLKGNPQPVEFEGWLVDGSSQVGLIAEGGPETCIEFKVFARAESEIEAFEALSAFVGASRRPERVNFELMEISELMCLAFRVRDVSWVLGSIPKPLKIFIESRAWEIIEEHATVREISLGICMAGTQVDRGMLLDFSEFDLDVMSEIQFEKLMERFDQVMSSEVLVVKVRMFVEAGWCGPWEGRVLDVGPKN